MCRNRWPAIGAVKFGNFLQSTFFPGPKWSKHTSSILRNSSQFYTFIVVRYSPLKFHDILNNFAVRMKMSLPDLRLINSILGHFWIPWICFSLTKARVFDIYHFSSLSKVSASNWPFSSFFLSRMRPLHTKPLAKLKLLCISQFQRCPSPPGH